MNTERMLELIYRKFDKFNGPDYLSQRPVTFCNQFVSQIAEGFGYLGFQGYLANDMIDKMNSSEDWISCTGIEAKARADKGYLTLAGLKEAVHGHVAVVLPGEEMVLSGKWKERCPQVANIGKTNFIGMGANFAFSKKPGYWYYATNI